MGGGTLQMIPGCPDAPASLLVLAYPKKIHQKSESSLCWPSIAITLRAQSYFFQHWCRHANGVCAASWWRGRNGCLLRARGCTGTGMLDSIGLFSIFSSHSILFERKELQLDVSSCFQSFQEWFIRFCPYQQISLWIRNPRQSEYFLDFSSGRYTWKEYHKNFLRNREANSEDTCPSFSWGAEKTHCYQKYHEIWGIRFLPV